MMSRNAGMPSGWRRVISGLRRHPLKNRTRSSSRRRMLPAPSIWGMPSIIPFRISSAAGSGCRGTTSSGCRAPTMPVLRRRTWSSVSWRPRKWIVTILAGRLSSSGSGSGRPNQAGRSSVSSSALAPPATGSASGLPWTKGCLRPFAPSLSSSMKTA